MRIYPFFNTLRNEETGDAGGSASTEGSNDVKQLVETAVAEAVAGLKTKNEELLGKLKAVSSSSKEQQSLLESLGGEEGVKELLNIKDKIANDEGLRLFSEGKKDEYDQMIIRNAQSRFERTIEQREKELNEVAKIRDSALQELQDLKLEQSFGEIIGSTKPYETSVSILIDRAKREGWSIGDDGEPQIRDDTTVLESGRAAVLDWLAKQKEVLPQLWPGASGGGGSSSGSGLRANGKLTAEQAANLSIAEYRKARKENRI